MTSHLRYAGQPAALQEQVLRDIVAHSAMLQQTLAIARDINLPDWWVVSGAIYNTVWNHLTGRPALQGIKDIDLFYFDPDLSYQAEAGITGMVQTRFPPPLPVDVRNEARVHLWFTERFGLPYPPLNSSAEAITRFASRTHCVGLRLTGKLEICAPYGLDDIFSFRLTPNPVLDNRATHEAKAARQLQHWPELTLVPWPE